MRGALSVAWGNSNKSPHRQRHYYAAHTLPLLYPLLFHQPQKKCLYAGVERQSPCRAAYRHLPEQQHGRAADALLPAMLWRGYCSLWRAVLASAAPDTRYSRLPPARLLASWHRNHADRAQAQSAVSCHAWLSPTPHTGHHAHRSAKDLCHTDAEGIDCAVWFLWRRRLSCHHQASLAQSRLCVRDRRQDLRCKNRRSGQRFLRRKFWKCRFKWDLRCRVQQSHGLCPQDFTACLFLGAITFWPACPAARG